MVKVFLFLFRIKESTLTLDLVFNANWQMLSKNTQISPKNIVKGAALPFLQLIRLCWLKVKGQQSESPKACFPGNGFIHIAFGAG